MGSCIEYSWVPRQKPLDDLMTIMIVVITLFVCNVTNVMSFKRWLG